MLELRSISKTFNAGTINEKKALVNVSLKLNDGDFCTVIGGNGAGKSTVMNAVAGVWPVDSGQILIGGEDVSALPEFRRAAYFGRVFQDPMTGTAGDMQIDENMALAARRGQRRTLRWGVGKKEEGEYRELLKKLDLGLEDRMSSKVGLLSGGQRQALTLLMATMKKPKVLEATDRIVGENRLTTLMVTHNMHDAIEHGNRLIMMSNGKIIYDVSGEEKKKLQVQDLLQKFEEAGGGVSDRMALS